VPAKRKKRWKKNGITFFRRDGTRAIWCKFWVGGQRYRRSTKTSDPKEAERAARSLRADIEANYVEEPTKRSRDFLMLIEWGTDDIARAEDRGRHPHYVDTLGTNWKTLLRVLGEDVRLHKISGADLELYIRTRKREGVRNQTVSKELTCLKRALRSALKDKRVKAMPAVKAAIKDCLDEWPEPLPPDPKDPMLEGVPRSPEVIRAVCEKATPELRDKIIFALCTGVRPEELTRVRFDMVRKAPVDAPVPAYLDLPDWATKKRKPRSQGIPPLALEILHRRFEANINGEEVFTSEDHKTQLRRISKELGLTKRFALKDMRKTHATWGTDLTGDIEAVRRGLGHSDVRMTQIYVMRQVDGAARIANVVAENLGEVPQSKCHTSHERHLALPQSDEIE
jgi:integrase